MVLHGSGVVVSKMHNKLLTRPALHCSNLF
jgi:hypothetical protein